jgi:hypothetical protein
VRPGEACVDIGAGGDQRGDLRGRLRHVPGPVGDDTVLEPLRRTGRADNLVAGRLAFHASRQSQGARRVSLSRGPSRGLPTSRRQMTGGRCAPDATRIRTGQDPS